MSLLAALEATPNDPIFGLNDQYNRDSSPDKVNLGVGMYQNEQGEIPLLESVQIAEERLDKAHLNRAYPPMEGLADYNAAAQKIVFGDSQAVADGRIVTGQSLGGTGGLTLAADVFAPISPDHKVLVSKPTWANHIAIMAHAGYEVDTYAYYDSVNKCVDFPNMLDDISKAKAGTIVILHECCHNPTGYDLNREQWTALIEVLRARRLMPLIDMAYQGFADGLDEDAETIRQLAETDLSFMVSSSFSKNFSLYGERIGAVHLVCADKEEAERVHSRVRTAARENYSTPPMHGAQIVTTVLNDPQLRTQWVGEVTEMRDRIKAMRAALVEGLHKAGVTDMDFINAQAGMFSYCGLSADEMKRLRDEYHVYGTDSGRLCVAALNTSNVAHVASSIAAVRS